MKKTHGVDLAPFQQQLNDKAKTYLTDIVSSIRPSTVRWMLLLAQNVFRRMFDQIVVNQDRLEQIKKIVEAKKDSVIFLPNHRSDMDFLLLSYINAFYNMELPFVCGSENFLKIPFIT
jgi:glycerol-3-phosphate O-acyltransferase